MKKLIIFLILILFLILNSVNAIEPNQTKDSDEPGPYNVGYYKVYYKNPNYGTYLATIRYPAKYDGLLAPIDDSNSPYPGIVVSNGWAGSEWNIKWIPKHLSSYGYITICFTPPNQFIGNTTQWAIGFKDGIEKLIEHNSLRFSPIYGLLDTNTFGAIGLSMGGAGCIEATGAIDSKINASVALAPASSIKSKNAAENITVPTQIQVGNNDGMVPPEKVLPYYTNLIQNISNKEYIAITGGNHIGFVDEFFARFAEWIGLDDPKEIEFEKQREISKKYFTAWFEYHLRGLDDYYTYIFGEKAQIDLDSGVLADFRCYIEEK